MTAPGSVVFLFPGQGSQYVGMGKAFFDSCASVRRRFEEASDVTGMDLVRLCFEGPEAELVQTANVQPAITLVNLACCEVLREEGILPSAAAGHSLGEYAALCAAGALSFSDTMRLVRRRGSAMQQAADRHPGGMTAVLGLDPDALSQICEEVSALGSVEVANHNSPTQVTLTGEKDALKRAAELAKQRGAKLTIPLKVSGAWHSRFMASAQQVMRAALDEVDVRQPSVRVVANVSGTWYDREPTAIRATLVAQMVQPVAWSRSITRLIEDGHRMFVEVGPGKVLTGMMKDIDKTVKVHTVGDPEGLSRLRAATAEIHS